VQRPIQEIEALRRDCILHEEEEQEIQEGKLHGLPNDAGNALEVEVTCKRAPPNRAASSLGTSL
jgi:hypothetical protein